MSTNTMQRTESTSISVPGEINSKGHIIVRDYSKTVEALSPKRCKGHKRFKQVLQQLSIAQTTIDNITMAPDLYGTHQQWLEWLWTISSAPFDVPLGQFLAMSGSQIQGNQKQPNVVIDWKSIRGQEELVHKAIRVLYPKPKVADLFPRILVYLFYVFSFPGSALILIKKALHKWLHIYVPHSVLWTATGFVNIVIMGRVLYADWTVAEYTLQHKFCAASFAFSIGLILVAGFYGLSGYFYHLYYLEEDWVKAEYHKKKNTKRHYAENRTVALLFKVLFQIELPSYTSAWVYPIIYPLLGASVGSLGFLILLKLRKTWRDGEVVDMLTWIGIIGGNFIAFTKAIRLMAMLVLFRDPVLERLKRIARN
eukprot:485452_1